MANKIMSGAEFCRIRRSLDLSQNDLAAVWQLGKGGSRTVRRWESEEVAISGPVALAILSMSAGLHPRWKAAAIRAGFAEGGNENAHGWIDGDGEIHESAMAACIANKIPLFEGE